jgi:hypothetical protein
MTTRCFRPAVVVMALVASALLGCASARRDALLEPVTPALMRRDDAGVTVITGRRRDPGLADRTLTCLHWPHVAGEGLVTAIAVDQGDYAGLCARYARAAGLPCPGVDFGRSVVLAFSQQVGACDALAALRLLSDGRIVPVFERVEEAAADCASFPFSAFVVVVPRARLPREFTLQVAGTERTGRLP